MNENRRAPVQGTRLYLKRDDPRSKPYGSIAWAEHLEAWENYAARFGHRQSAERIAERHGFEYWEITELLGHEPKTWKAEQ